AWLLEGTAATLRLQSYGCSRSRHVFRRNPWSYDVLPVVSCCYSSWPSTCTATTLRGQNCGCSVDKTTHKKSENGGCAGREFMSCVPVKPLRSEERRVGKEGRCRGAPDPVQKQSR